MALGYQDEVKTTDVTKQFRENKLNKYGQTTTEAGGIKRKKKKKKIVPRDRSNTPRQGVGTLEGIKPKRKDMTGVNQTPISFKDVAKSTGQGALEGLAFGASGAGVKAGVKALNKFSKVNLLQKFKNMFKGNETVQKFFPKAVKRITDQRTNAQKQLAMNREIARLIKQRKISGGKNVRAGENPNLTAAERAGGKTFNKGGMVKKAAYKKGGAVKMKKGGVVKKTRSTTKKKSIDGIAMRGKTRATRSR